MNLSDFLSFISTATSTATTPLLPVENLLISNLPLYAFYTLLSLYSAFIFYAAFRLGYWMRQRKINKALAKARNAKSAFKSAFKTSREKSRKKSREISPEISPQIASRLSTHYTSEGPAEPRLRFRTRDLSFSSVDDLLLPPGYRC